MKKTLSVILSVIMLFAMCVPAFAGAQIDALTNPMQKTIAGLIQKQYDESQKPEKMGALSTSTTPTYIGDKIGGLVNLKTVSIDTLEADVSAAFDAAFADLNPTDIKGVPFLSKPDTVQNFKNLTFKAIKTAIIKSGTLLALDKVSVLSGYQAKIANLIIKVSSEESLDPMTATAQSRIAEYVLANIGIDAYYDVVYAEGTDESQVDNDCLSAVTAVWTDNDVVLTAGENNATITAATTAISTALKTKLAEIAKSKGEGGGAPGSLLEWFEKIFSNFTDGDFNEMFSGFGDAIKKIGTSLSDLFGGLFGGGNDTPTTTTKKPSSSSNGTTSIPKTGDVALYSVAALSVVAGIALVLTKKKKDDK